MIPIHSNSSCSAMGASLVGLRPGTWGIGIMSPYYPKEPGPEGRSIKGVDAGSLKAPIPSVGNDRKGPGRSIECVDLGSLDPRCGYPAPFLPSASRR
jgi:hypothetical protein